MNRQVTSVRVAAALLGAIWLVLSQFGCAAAPSANMGSEARPLIAAEKNARIEVDPTRTNVNRVYVNRVVAPVDGLLIVTSLDPKSGTSAAVGTQAVKRGETTDVQILLGDFASEAVTVTLLADTARQGTFQSDMGEGSPSPNRPVYASGHPVAVSVTIHRDPINVRSGAAVLDVFDQKRAKTIELTHVVTPGPSWVVVYAEEAGKPGRVLSRSSLAATDAIDVAVPFNAAAGASAVFVAIHADTGVPGVFEYGSSYDPASISPDRPYVAGGTELVKRITLR